MGMFVIAADDGSAQSDGASPMKKTFRRTRTGRGFAIRHFSDEYGIPCSIQKSSLATRDAIWFGVDDVRPIVMAVNAASVGVNTEQRTGWVPYPIPEAVLLHTRMHLTRAQVKKLLPVLQAFVDTGNI